MPIKYRRLQKERAAKRRADHHDLSKISFMIDDVKLEPGKPDDVLDVPPYVAPPPRNPSFREMMGRTVTVKPMHHVFKGSNDV